MSKLAIVIPAYKSKYLREALDCFRNQTSKDFNLYIGDDCSPDNLYEIINEYNTSLNIHYHKFDSNIGARNIIDQWERSIALINDEEWIWLFSDDDLVDNNAVESFWKTLEISGGGYDLYSFNTCVIDKSGGVISPPPEIPDYETGEQMAYYLLEGKRANCMPDHIFSRRVYHSNNGFVRTAFAQGADWANSILFSSEKGIKIIPDAIVYWRYSGDNITSVASYNQSEMIIGHFQFIEWVLKHFSYLKDIESSGERYQIICEAARKNLLRIVWEHYRGVPVSRFCFFYRFLRKYFRVSIFQSLHYLFLSSTFNVRIIKIKFEF
ncbi:MAG: glycosyltransferase [Bacteroidales bacterium]